ncbi:MAG TPA: FixH family protein [Xanthobacteraceae bacterium]
MRFHYSARALIGAAIFAGSTLAEVHALAAPADYNFELVQAQPSGPGKTNVTVRLIHVPDHKPVAGAVLFETKSDMGPAGMAEMPGKVTALPSDKPGLYRVQIETGMAGTWALNLAAKVQGEAGTVRGTVNFAAAK